jgi:hypothetical protein
MHTHAVMKDRRSTCAKLLRSVGLDGETKSFKDKDLMQDIQSSWLLAILIYEL